MDEHPQKPFQPLKTKRTFELIVDLLKDKIFAGEYQIGDRLPPERDLADALGVGRPSVREAYRVLELLGVVEIRKGAEGGAFIKELSGRSASQTITDLWRMKNVTLASLAQSRLIIETGLVDQIIERLTENDLVRLEASIRENEEAVKTGGLPSRSSLDMHLELVRISGNPVMVMVLSSILDLMWMFLKRVQPNVDIARHDLDEHRLIIAALRDRDAARLRLLLDRHLQNSRKRLEAVGRDTRSLSASAGDGRATGGL
jgi:DNA-binding FadR family transcriptional regulator